MVFFLAPVAAGAYMYYKKKKGEEADVKGVSSEQSTCEDFEGETAWDLVEDADQIKGSPSVASEETVSLSDSMGEQSRQSALADEEQDTPTVNPRGDTAAKAGPMSNFLKFCDNLEKEYEKAQGRKAREVTLDEKLVEFQVTDKKVVESKVNDLDDKKAFFGYTPKIASANASVPRITFK
jgi:hypothetical protein